MAYPGRHHGIPWTPPRAQGACGSALPDGRRSPSRASAPVVHRPAAWQPCRPRESVMRRTVYAWGVIWVFLLSSPGLHAGPPAWAAEQTVLHWWHAMRGQLGDTVEALAQQFNARQA